MHPGRRLEASHRCRWGAAPSCVLQLGRAQTVGELHPDALCRNPSFSCNIAHQFGTGIWLCSLLHRHFTQFAFGRSCTSCGSLCICIPLFSGNYVLLHCETLMAPDTIRLGGPRHSLDQALNSALALNTRVNLSCHAVTRQPCTASGYSSNLDLRAPDIGRFASRGGTCCVGAPGPRPVDLERLDAGVAVSALTVLPQPAQWPTSSDSQMQISTRPFSSGA